MPLIDLNKSSNQPLVIPDEIARDTEVASAIAGHLAAADPHSQYVKNITLLSRGSIANATPGFAALNITADGSNASERALNGAFIAFHRPLIAAYFFGLDTDNVLKLGGWSNPGSTWRIWHESYGIPTWQTPSDKKLKRSIRPIKSALQFILESQPVSFEFKADIRNSEFFGDKFQRGKVHYGFIAQDFPLQDLVSEKPNGYLGIDYIEIVPFLVRAIQELQEQIDGLKLKLQEK